MADLQMSLHNVLHTFPIGRVISPDNTRRVLAQALFGAVFVDEHNLGKRDVQKRNRQIDDMLRRLVSEGALQSVPGGYLRGHDDQERSQRIGFDFDGQHYEVPRAQYEEKVAQLRTEKLNRSPLEAQRRRVELLEQQLAVLKEGLQ